MSRCIIFGAAAFDGPMPSMENTDLIIAADGGLRHFTDATRQPDVILGDFDSLGYIPQGAKVFPVEKDDTDVMLAVRHGLDRGFREFLIYGGMDGPRLDHTMANFQTLSFLRTRDARGFLVGNTHVATVISSETIAFPENYQGVLSVFCLGQDATGVTIQGLQYSLENGTLTASHPLGVSNHFVGKPSRISVENGSLLLIWEKQAGFPVIP